MEKGLFFGLLLFLASCVNKNSSIAFSDTNDTTAIFSVCTAYMTPVKNTWQFDGSLPEVISEAKTVESVRFAKTTKKDEGKSVVNAGYAITLENITVSQNKACCLLYDKKTNNTIAFMLEKIGDNWTVMDISKLSETRL